MSDFVLPEIGTHENQELDFKAKLNTKDGKTDYLELAKDMAAMANAYGGTIIIGACEDPKGVLSVYKPLTEEEAAFTCNEYKTAQRDRLRPTPIVVPDMISHEGGFLVTVKVEPSMGQAIGVRFIPKVDVEPETKQPPEIYGFPLRVGDNTTWLQPEQLPMLMIPTLRRNIVLLRQTIKHHVQIETILPRGDRLEDHQGHRVQGIDEEANVVDCGPGWIIPLDQIVSVWKSGQWRILWNKRGF
jgi:hypothetical protein